MTKNNKQDQQHLPFPQKIGPYKIEALLDKGGMSYLYLATHPETKEPLAIKVLSQKYISNPDVVQRFLNEAEIIAMTNHPNIIGMYGHGEWEGGLYIAMEYIEGSSLRKYIQTNHLSLKKALEMILDIAYALCHLHTHGVIHRDLKPENILVTDNGAIKVIDFGIAQLLAERPDLSEPSKQQLIGTPIYISPEQKDNPETVSFPSDIYSLGIVAYELILNKLSHGHIHLSLMPKGMQSILSKCLQPNPEDRYQDIVDFITDVSNYLDSPSFEKDLVPADKISKISDDLKLIQEILIPFEAPRWTGLEIGTANYKVNSNNVVYYDFFDLSEECYGVIFGESSAPSAEGSVILANFRGMVRSLLPFSRTPLELVTVLNDLLSRDDLGLIFNFNYLVFNKLKKTLTYISCGHNNVWKWDCGKNVNENEDEHEDQHEDEHEDEHENRKNGNKNEDENGKSKNKNEDENTKYHLMVCSAQPTPLGADRTIRFQEMTIPFEIGDVIFLNNFSMPQMPQMAQMAQHNDEINWGFKEEYFIHAVNESYQLDVQKQVDHILRKLRLTVGEVIRGRNLTLIAFRNN